MKKRNYLSQQQMAWLVILPGLLGFILFFIWPFILSVYYSFLDSGVSGNFVGFDNYIALLKNEAYKTGLLNTLRFISISVSANIILSLLFSLCLEPIKKHTSLYLFIFLIPLVIPSGSMVFFWKNFFAKQGMLNGLLDLLGMESQNWLDSQLTFYVMLGIFLWKNIGYNMVLFTSGLKSIPLSFYEVAKIEGASPFQTFSRVTLPSLATTMIPTIILSIINSFKVFKEIFLITGAYPNKSIYMLQHFMNNMFYSLDYQKLTTAMIILIFGLGILSNVLLGLERKVIHS